MLCFVGFDGCLSWLFGVFFDLICVGFCVGAWLFGYLFVLGILGVCGV